ncbi:hypothetical protein PABG_11583 [Paracoccidioides brasiliensis Pb03]|nr:hypothetical protein PABG_11583 [Paracoccidioides brasiliensis Pb03]
MSIPLSWVPGWAIKIGLTLQICQDRGGRTFVPNFPQNQIRTAGEYGARSIDSELKTGLLTQSTPGPADPDVHRVSRLCCAHQRSIIIHPSSSSSSPALPSIHCRQTVIFRSTNETSPVLRSQYRSITIISSFGQRKTRATFSQTRDVLKQKTGRKRGTTG